MRKTFCDKCGKECVNKTYKVYAEVVHATRNDEVVGRDDFEPAELCGECGDKVIASIPLKHIMRAKEDYPDDEPMARVMESRSVR